MASFNEHEPEQICGRVREYEAIVTIEMSDRLCVSANTPSEARLKINEIVNGWVSNASLYGRRCTIEAVPVLGTTKIIHLREV